MALPYDLSAFIESNGTPPNIVGPFKVGSKYYIVGANSTVINVVMASSPSTSWAAQDTANRPSTGGFGINGVGACVSGSTIHVVAMTSGGDIDYHTFNCSTDQWAITEESVATGTVNATKNFGIGVRSDGDVVIMYDGAIESIMGTSYSRSYFAERISGSWTVDVRADNQGKVSEDLKTHAAVMAYPQGTPSDRFHGLYRGTSSELRLSVFRSGGDFGTGGQHIAVDSATSYPSILATHIDSYDQSGTSKIRASHVDDASNDVNVFGWNDADAPSVSEVASDITDNQLLGNQKSFAFAVDGTTQHILYTPSARTSILHDSSGAGNDTWGTDDTHATSLSTVKVFDANVYDSVIGFIYQDGGTEYYDEYSLASGDNLTATGLKVTVSTGTPAIAQTHALTGTGIRSATATGAPSLGQIHGLIATGIQVSVSTGTPNVAESHALTATGLSVTVSTGTPAIAQTHALTALGLDVAVTTGAPAITQIHGLTATGLAVAVSTGAPAISQTHGLAATGLDVAVSTGAPAIAQAHALAATGLAVSVSTGAPSIAQSHVLSANGLDIAVSTGRPVLASEGAHVLTATGLSVSVATGAPAIAQTHVLTASGLAVSVATGTPAISQTHALGGAGLDVAVSTGLPSPGQTHALSASGLDVAVSTGLGVVGQTHALTATGLDVATATGTSSISQIHGLTAAGLSVSVSTGTPTAAEEGTDVLTATGIRSAVSTGAPPLGQTHGLTATGIVASVFTGTPPVTELVILAATGIAISTSISHTSVVDFTPGSSADLDRIAARLNRAARKLEGVPGQEGNAVRIRRAAADLRE